LFHKKSQVNKIKTSFPEDGKLKCRLFCRWVTACCCRDRLW